MTMAPAVERDTKLARLGRHPLLAGCSQVEGLRLGAVFDEVDLPAGTILVGDGELARWFFLIDKGEAEVISGDGAGAILGPGDYCGEAALERRGFEPTTVRAR